MKKYVLLIALIMLSLVFCACSVQPVTPNGSSSSTNSGSSSTSSTSKPSQSTGESTSQSTGSQDNQDSSGTSTLPLPDDYPQGPNLPGTIDSLSTCAHTFVDNVCTACETQYSPYVFSIFGQNVIIFDNDTPNPYDVNLDNLGSDVNAIFYTPNLADFEDPYLLVNKTEFYADSYTAAWCYEDSYYRTKHHLLSGDNAPQNHAPSATPLRDGNQNIAVTTATYILTPDGDFLGYIVNDFYGEQQIIYYGAGYTSLEEVAAYLLAFGEVPANSDYAKGSSGKKQSVADWGVFGRVNVGNFRNTGSSTEPKLPGSASYLETDFGTAGGYTVGNRTQTAYNNGTTITRGTARFVFVPITSAKSIDSRYVFYTYNHYNDFQQYLNYKGGWGTRFGNESAGNSYSTAGKTPTAYPLVSLAGYLEAFNYV